MISVVIPLYNKVRHIKRALDSVLSQTYHDFEVVVVNDGSSDGSENVAEEYADPRIRLVHREHINSWGGHTARNLGIESAKFELIAFLDADDEWLPDHLETLYRLSVKYPECGAYATAFEFVQPDGRNQRAKFKFIPDPPWEGIIDNYFKSSLGGSPMFTSAVTIKSRVFKEVGTFPEGVKRGGDLDMWARVALKYPIAFSNNISAIYYRNASNRVCVNIADPLGEKDNALYITLKNAINSRDFSKDINVSDLQKYLNTLSFTYAKRNLIVGNKILSRNFIKEIQPVNTRSFLLFVLSILPTKSFNTIITVKRNVFKTMNRYIAV